jgi:hypothetical protein
VTVTANPFLLKDYELKVAFLTAQFARMWTRFNFMLVLESGLLAAAANTKHHTGVRAIVWAEVLISAVWYVFGAQDKYLVEVYRGQVEAAARELRKAHSMPETSPYVGQVEGRLVSELHIKRHPLQWRFKYASVTHLAALFPLLALVAWLVTATVLSV